MASMTGRISLSLFGSHSPKYDEMGSSATTAMSGLSLSVSLSSLASESSCSIRFFVFCFASVLITTRWRITALVRSASAAMSLGISVLFRSSSVAASSTRCAPRSFSSRLGNPPGRHPRYEIEHR